MQTNQDCQPAFTNLVQLLTTSIEHYADRPLFGTIQADSIAWTTYGEFGRLVDRCRSGLHSLGVGPGDAVALIVPNSVEWAVVAYATFGSC